MLGVVSVKLSRQWVSHSFHRFLFSGNLSVISVARDGMWYMRRLSYL